MANTLSLTMNSQHLAARGVLRINGCIRGGSARPLIGGLTDVFYGRENRENVLCGFRDL